ncbi:conserved hypothetical protein [Flavobacterium sp. 9AF]|uniref:hypothetical protein n=1 Tax=Flavobacterium sp. 9AF TaxID=2653142 RepID=UPI0012F46291|nr:hypothetical protein [Flavobacterium sp. 9AF]VXB26089.1 conserved hypothetical protein [Flavobacterium sp. 9AF]
MKKTILSLKNASLITKDELKKINGGVSLACYRVICGLTQSQCNAYPLMISYNPSNGCCSIETGRC